MSGQYEKQLINKLKDIIPANRGAGEECRKRWDSLAKPLDGLGRFEEIIVRLAAIQRSADVKIRPRAAVIMCADHGVVSEHVTQTGSEATASVARAVVENRSTVSVIAEAVSADVFAVDIGMKAHEPIPGIEDCSVGRGTGNIALGPAMSREDACLAVLKGMEKAEKLAKEGYYLLAAGEMGIGNTTASAAVLSVLSGLDPSEVTGRGAGLPEHLYRHKIEVVRKAILKNRPDGRDPLDVLSRLGGFEIAGMTGLYLGGARAGTAVVLDGLISAVSALLAKMLCPAAGDYMIPSHTGREPGSEVLMELLQEKPVLDAGMALGEGTGALMLFPLLDAALALYRKGQTFHHLDLDPYERYQSS